MQVKNMRSEVIGAIQVMRNYKKKEETIPQKARINREGIMLLEATSVCTVMQQRAQRKD